MLQVRSFIHTPRIKPTIYSQVSSVTLAPFRTASTSSQYHVAKIWNSRNTDLTVRHSSAGFVQQHLRNITMASATSVYEFEPLNSEFPSSLLPLHHTLPSHLHPAAHSLPCSKPHLILTTSPISRKGRTSAHVRLPRQSHPHRQHGLEMRFHAAIRRAGETLQTSQREAR
jgi:hypothetical protein